MLESLNTTDNARANELLAAENEASREPAFDLQKTRVYMAASDPAIATRTWREALAGLIASKPVDSETRKRWGTFAHDKALEPILDLVVLETSADQLLQVAVAHTVSTNIFLRRLHNFCIGMKWLPWSVLAQNSGRKSNSRKREGSNMSST